MFITGIAVANRQNYLCKACGRQFVEQSSQLYVSGAQKAIVNKLLLEKISLAGISRVATVSEGWLVAHISDLYASCPNNLCTDVQLLLI
jgi:transposase-like protein